MTRIRVKYFVLVLGLFFCLFGGAASAQNAALPSSACDMPVTDTVKGNVIVAIDTMTIWQPRGGEVKFTVTGPGFDPEGMIACFRWEESGSTVAMPSPAIRRVNNDTQGTFAFAATVPNMSPPKYWWLDRAMDFAGNRKSASTGLWVVPLADFRVIANSGQIDVTHPLGITSVGFSFLIAVLVVLIAATALHLFGVSRGVPGRNSPLLKIIATRDGYASLSQLQIVLWSFVVGASAVYVMALSGNLIIITNGTLVLLGISGIAVVGAQVQPQQGGSVQGQTRKPQWSDLVIAADDQNEIDVTRVQMLFFTVIVALFVILRVLSSGSIPEIPEGYQLLMGISNGVYLTAKFVPSGNRTQAPPNNPGSSNSQAPSVTTSQTLGPPG